MADARKRLVLVGAGEFAQIACEYFEEQGHHEVVAFAVEAAHQTDEEVMGRPVWAVEELEEKAPPAEVTLFVAITYTKLNEVRRRLYLDLKARGYRFASYVSPHAFVWHNATVGENTFIFENNVIQYHARIGDNVVLWSGNHIGHRATVEDHVYMASHVVVSGFCVVGSSSFVGVNVSVNDKVRIGAGCVVGSGAVVVRDTEPGEIYVGNPARKTGKPASEAF